MSSEKIQSEGERSCVQMEQEKNLINSASSSPNGWKFDDSVENKFSYNLKPSVRAFPPSPPGWDLNHVDENVNSGSQVSNKFITFSFAAAGIRSLGGWDCNDVSENGHRLPEEPLRVNPTKFKKTSFPPSPKGWELPPSQDKTQEHQSMTKQNEETSEINNVNVRRPLLAGSTPTLQDNANVQTLSLLWSALSSLGNSNVQTPSLVVSAPASQCVSSHAVQRPLPASPGNANVQTPSLVESAPASQCVSSHAVQRPLPASPGNANLKKRSLVVPTPASKGYGNLKKRSFIVTESASQGVSSNANVQTPSLVESAPASQCITSHAVQMPLPASPGNANLKKRSLVVPTPASKGYVNLKKRPFIDTESASQGKVEKPSLVKSAPHGSEYQIDRETFMKIACVKNEIVKFNKKTESKKAVIIDLTSSDDE